MEITTAKLLDLEKTIAMPLLRATIYPWEAIPKIRDFILSVGEALDVREYEKRGESVYISRQARVDETVKINGPCIICRGAEIRQGAFIRGNAIIGESCVVGNSSEIKSSILFNECQVPHFNYAGDSILGYRSHLGAGAKISNLKSDKSNINIKYGNETIKTDLKKLGAIIGDYVEIGCNAVLNPGTIIGKNTTIYPLTNVRGYVSEDSIYKGANDIIKKGAKSNS